MVIPAAGAGRRMAGVLGGAVPKALLEVGRRPAIVEILRGIEAWGEARGAALEYRIVTGPSGGAALRRFLRAYYRGTSLGRRLRFYSQPRPRGPLDAVLRAGPPDGRVLLWLCDTLLLGPWPELAPDTLVAAPVRGDLSPWCLAHADASGRLTRLEDKPRGRRGEGLALVGVYAFSDGAEFRRAGRAVLADRERRGGEYQLSSALERYACARPLRVARTEAWHDLGEPSRFLHAKERLLERLDSHEIRIDAASGRVAKRATLPEGRAALSDEAAWYRRMSGPIGEALPPGARLRGGVLESGYVDLPSLSDWYLYRSFYAPEKAREAFSDLLGWTRARLHAKARSTAAERERANRFMLVEKTERRLEGLRGRGLLTRVSGRAGGPRGSWSALRSRFLALADRYAPSEEGDWRTLHGDLVLSNVLTDAEGRRYLLDPRGSYGSRRGAEGDRAYDYAKLAQCVLSQYDSIKKGEFRLRESAAGDQVCFPHEDAPGRRAWRRELLGALSEEGLDVERVRFFEAALLLSLLPLHLDDPAQVRAAYAAAMSLLAGLR